MANINLLPWREERRQELKQAFLIVLGIVAALAAALVFIGDSLVSSGIDAQTQRNNYLKQNIEELTLQVQEIDELEKKKQELEDRMKVIQELQGNRPIIVRIFDDMVNTLPDGVYFSELERIDNKITVKGIAESNNRISSLMRRLDGSDWFASSNLKEVAAEPSLGEQASRFNLFFDISSPSLIVEEE
jgi:type IV pilus assembly protein PilN